MTDEARARDAGVDAEQPRGGFVFAFDDGLEERRGLVVGGAGWGQAGETPRCEVRAL